ncbi:phage head closure protein [Burkholderia cenocepacia]|uniref:phage head closure protein n=1 Tax=Burkholderia cenocepacia TaxID=95486 RepID=UPI0038CBFA50
MQRARATQGRTRRGLRAGPLNNKASLQRRTAGVDALGQPLEQWVEYANVWCAVLQLTGKEKVVGGTQVGGGRASIRIRYRTDVQNQDRAVVQGQVFNIAVPLPDVSSRTYTDLVCTEDANLG